MVDRINTDGSGRIQLEAPWVNRPSEMGEVSSEEFRDEVVHEDHAVPGLPPSARVSMPQGNSASASMGLKPAPTAPHPTSQAALSVSPRSPHESRSQESSEIPQNRGDALELSPDIMDVGITSTMDKYPTSYFLAFFMRHGTVVGELELLLRTLRNAYDDLASVDDTTAISRRLLKIRQELGASIRELVRQEAKLHAKYTKSTGVALGKPNNHVEQVAETLRVGSQELIQVMNEASANLSAISDQLAQDGKNAVNAKIRETGRNKADILSQALSIADEIYSHSI